MELNKKKKSDIKKKCFKTGLVKYVYLYIFIYIYCKTKILKKQLIFSTSNNQNIIFINIVNLMI